MGIVEKLLASAGRYRLTVWELLRQSFDVHVSTGLSLVLVGRGGCRLLVRYREGEPEEFLLHTPQDLPQAA